MELLQSCAQPSKLYLETKKEIYTQNHKVGTTDYSFELKFRSAQDFVGNVYSMKKFVLYFDKTLNIANLFSV